MSLRVLIIAFEFRPSLEQGSYHLQPVNNWKIVEQLARFCEVNVMTNSTSQGAVLDELSKGSLPSVKMHFVELPKWLQSWYTQDPHNPLIAYFWEKKALRSALRLHKEAVFDAVHDLSPSLLWPPLVGADFPAAFFWGPISGKSETQEERVSTRSWGLGLLRAGLTFLLVYSGKRKRLRRRCVQKAKVIFLENPAHLTGIPSEARDKVRFVASAGISERDLPKRSAQNRNQRTFSILALGGFLEIEGLIYTVRAFNKFHQNHPTANLTLIGPKQADPSLLSVIHQLGLEFSVHRKGWMPQEGLLQELSHTNLYITPDSSKASALWTVSALASGVPVVAVQGRGGHLFVDDKWGIKIPWEDSQQIIRDLALAMEYIQSDPVRWRRMGQAAVRYVKDYLLWEKQGDLLKVTYAEEILQSENIHVHVSGNARMFY